MNEGLINNDRHLLLLLLLQLLGIKCKCRRGVDDEEDER